MYKLTDRGKRVVSQYISELKAKRKEILDAGKDTADETNLPTVDDIISDIEWTGVDEDGSYLNGWGVTDNYDSDYALELKLGRDFIEASTSIKCSTRDSYKVDWLKKALQNMQEDEYFVPKLKVNDSGRFIDLDEGAIQVLIDYYN